MTSSVPANQAPALRPVGIFAHNEERVILECLRSVDQPGVRPFVLLNGCTDGTERVVEAFVREGGRAEIVRIARGDKANAWNVFVHEAGPPADVWYFVDADVTIEAGAFEALANTLRRHPGANAAAAVPRSGRSRAWMTQLVTVERLLMGNLYALNGAFVDRLRHRGTRMPVGYIGEDGWITSMAKWDGDPAGPWREDRVEPSPEAGYSYRSFSPMVPSDWRKYWRRRVRYSLRHFQHLLLREALLEGGLPAMPADIADLYVRRASVSKLRPRPREFVFDWLALRAIRQGGR
jgi:glycosyltransferase involved in cell wall biosynthesis